MKKDTSDVVIDLSALEHDLSEGIFYQDYDESWRLVGRLRDGIAELERLRAAIRLHRERDASIRDAVGTGQVAPHDEELWAVLKESP